MTSEERVKLFEMRDKIFNPRIFLSDACLMVRCSINGSSDPWATELLKNVLVFLDETIRLWTPCRDAIDAAVLVIVHSTVDLLRKELKERGEITNACKSL